MSQRCNHYYYTVASLPPLELEARPLLSEEDFLDLCGRTVSERDHRILRENNLRRFQKGAVPSRPIPAFWQREESLRISLEELRSEKRGKEFSSGGIFISRVEARAIAKTALQMTNPYEAELFLLRDRWDFLGNLESGHFSDLVNLAVYYVRLQLAERLAGFEPEKGHKNYEELLKLSAKAGESISL